MRTLFLTLDYELYGNGSGDVFHHIIEPTDRILKIAEKYNAKLTNQPHIKNKSGFGRPFFFSKNHASRENYSKEEA